MFVELSQSFPSTYFRDNTEVFDRNHSMPLHESDIYIDLGLGWKLFQSSIPTRIACGIVYVIFNYSFINHAESVHLTNTSRTTVLRGSSW